MNISITRNSTLHVEHRPVELVERKGVGHPDTLCDRAAEELSVALSRYYHDHGGAILHHNTDKVLLVGGRAHAVFGHGEVLDPMYMLLSGRATTHLDGQPVPVGSLAVQHTAEWIHDLLPHLRLPGDIIIDYRIKPSSPDLVSLFRGQGVPLANDTSFAVAFAPFSELECIVKRITDRLNSPEIRARYPQLGQDVKVMGLRVDDDLFLTVSVAFIAAETPDMETYQAVKTETAELIRAIAGEHTRRAVHVSVNAADQPDEGSVYLTVTGTSAEQGDDGQVGRGNRATGLITPMRPMTLEAAAGKNPVSHVGKIYQVYAQLMVDKIIRQLPEVQAAVCTLLSRIGAPINQPQAVAIKVESALPDDRLRATITRIIHEVLDDWADIRDGFLERRWQLY